MSPFSVRILLMQYFWALVLIGAESTLWYRLLGPVPSPQLWLLWLLYLALHRNYFEALFVGYGLAVLMTPASSVSLKILWPTFFVLVSLSSYARNKVFWPGLRYFMIASLTMSVGWNLFSVLFSLLFESPSTPLMPLTRILGVAITVLCSPLVYLSMNWLERFRPDENMSSPPPHSGGHLS